MVVVWRGVLCYLVGWMSYPTYYAKMLDNRQVYDKQQVLCKQSFTNNLVGRQKILKIGIVTIIVFSEQSFTTSTISD